jgi:hypothetical protein
LDKNTKKWSTVVTSNIPGQDIEQEVRYSDPPKVQLKVMETNYENLKPNLKIKIPSKNNSDEDWNDEAVAPYYKLSYVRMSFHFSSLYQM